MKFGKSIRAESRSNRGLAFINFKFLKRIIKRSAVAARAGYAETAASEDAVFLTALETELTKVSTAYWNELREIASLQTSVISPSSSAARILQSDDFSEIYRDMTFEQLQNHLESLGGLRDQPTTTTSSSPSPLVLSSYSLVSTAASLSSTTSSYEWDTSAAQSRAAVVLCEFCVALSQLSARCKRLRGCVVWNMIAVVKILKKRQKQQQQHGAGGPSLHHSLAPITAVEVLAKQSWYREPQLPQIVSTIELSVDRTMFRLTSRVRRPTDYCCLICLKAALDPVCLRACGHRFCWGCLCDFYLEKTGSEPGGAGVEKCPSCRAPFALDPLAFQVDGILARFLLSYFPEAHPPKDLKDPSSSSSLLLRSRSAAVSRTTTVAASCCPDCAGPVAWNSEFCTHEMRVRSGRPADVLYLAERLSSVNRNSDNETSAEDDDDGWLVRGVIDNLLGKQTNDEDEDYDYQHQPLGTTAEKRGQQLRQHKQLQQLPPNASRPSVGRAESAAAGGGSSGWASPAVLAKFVIANEPAESNSSSSALRSCRTLTITNAFDEDDDLDFVRATGRTTGGW